MKRKKERKKTGNESIRSKIMARMSLTVLVALVVSGVVSSLLNYTSTIALLRDAMAETASIAAERVSYELRSYSNIAWAPSV